MFEERGHIGREGVRCLDGVLVWVEGLKLGGRCSGGRARCSRAGIRRSRIGGQPRPRHAPAWERRGATAAGAGTHGPRHARGAAALAQVSSGAPARVRPSSPPDPAAVAMCSSFLHFLRHRSKGVPGRRTVAGPDAGGGDLCPAPEGSRPRHTAAG